MCIEKANADELQLRLQAGSQSVVSSSLSRSASVGGIHLAVVYLQGEVRVYVNALRSAAGTIDLDRKSVV
jgi:hypothetical protein